MVVLLANPRPRWRATCSTSFSHANVVPNAISTSALHCNHNSSSPNQTLDNTAFDPLTQDLTDQTVYFAFALLLPEWAESACPLNSTCSCGGRPSAVLNFWPIFSSLLRGSSLSTPASTFLPFSGWPAVLVHRPTRQKDFRMLMTTPMTSLSFSSSSISPIAARVRLSHVSSLALLFLNV